MICTSIWDLKSTGEVRPSNDPKVGFCLFFGSYLRHTGPQSQNSVIVILLPCHIEWHTFCLVNGRLTPRSRTDQTPQVMTWVREVKLHISRFGSLMSSQWCPFRFSSSILQGVIDEKTLITPKNSCDFICDVTQSKKSKEKVQKHYNSLWQQYLMYLKSDYNTYIPKWSMPVLPPIGLL